MRIDRRMSLLPILVVCGLVLPMCRGDKSAPSGDVLDYGDAEWDRPPFAVPGGEGENADYGDDGFDSGAPGGTGGFDDGGTSGPAGTSSSGTTGSTDSGSTGGSSTGDGSTGGSSTGDGSTGGSSTGGSSTGMMAPADPRLQVDRAARGPAPMCPAEQEPAIIYMSNDDSNSQASPVLARQTVAEGLVVSPFRIRIHEFLNYYDLSYQNPTDAPASVGMQMRRINAETGEFVLLAYAQGQLLAAEDRPPMNLVFSLDNSGSMNGVPLQLLKDTMTAIAGSLRAGDVVSIVTWDTETATLLESHEVAGPDDPTLLAVIGMLDAGGATDLNNGLTTAYALAEANYADDRINRVVMISDGGANAGVTDINLIAGAADDSDRQGIYLVGVGVDDRASDYRDDLMDAVTDAGKGAYVFIDSTAEANHMFGKDFLQNMTVSARNVRMELTMPWYFAITEFHGEEYSEDPDEVDPQHLSYNDAMSYHQIIQACDPEQIFTTDLVKAKVTFQDPITREDLTDELELPIGEIVQLDASQLYKGDVVVAYAQAFIVIGHLSEAGDAAAAKQVATDMVGWLQEAENALGDPEIAQMRAVMQQYAGNL